jgi:hypothetical protein
MEVKGLLHLVLNFQFEILIKCSYFFYTYIIVMSNYKIVT